MMTSSDARLARERTFHDDRFQQEVRLAQRKYYSAVRDAFEDYRTRRDELAQGADILDYGCAKGFASLTVAPQAKSVTGIDLSGVAIDEAQERAKTADLTNTRFDVMNAEAMTFPDNSFDAIFGSGILHHLDIQRCYAELHRVLRPGGRVIFIEPLGHNPVLEAYRKLTPRARTEDEHPLRIRDIRAFTEIFDDVKTQHYGLATLGAVPLRNTSVAKAAFGLTRRIDKVLFRLPGFKWWAWFCVIEGRKKPSLVQV